MFSKRINTVITTITVGGLLLVGCTPTSEPTPPTITTTTPTPTATTVAPPANEEEAIAAADAALTNWFIVRGEVNAAGGTDTDRLEALALGTALELTLNDAANTATGPVLNEDQVNIDGPATTEGAMRHELITAYGQEYEGIDNGMVTINACQDASEYVIRASDGSLAMRPERQRVLIDFDVVYDAERQAWLVYKLTNLDQPC